MPVVRLLTVICILSCMLDCQAEDFRPSLAPGFYHIRFQISDMDMSRVIEVREVRGDKVFGDGGFMEVTWVGMWPEDPSTFIPADRENRVRTTGILNPKGIQMAIPEVKTSRAICVYYFSFAPKPDKDGSFSGAGDVPFDGPNGNGKNRFNCEMTPLPGFKIPPSKKP